MTKCHDKKKKIKIASSTMSFFTGGGVAIELASRPDSRMQFRALIVENTFTSIPDMAKALLQKNKFITQLPLCCYKNKVAKC